MSGNVKTIWKYVYDYGASFVDEISSGTGIEKKKVQCVIDNIVKRRSMVRYPGEQRGQPSRYGVTPDCHPVIGVTVGEIIE